MQTNTKRKGIELFEDKEFLAICICHIKFPLETLRESSVSHEVSGESRVVTIDEISTR